MDENISSTFFFSKKWEVAQSYKQNCGYGGLTAAAALWYAGYLTLTLEQSDKGMYSLTVPNYSMCKGFEFLFAALGSPIQ